MTKERLQVLSLEVLQDMALRNGISPDLARESLVDTLIEAFEEEKIDREKANNTVMRVKEKKFDIVRDDEIESQEKKEYPIPQSYNETRVVFMLRDPFWAFTYWEINKLDLEWIENANPESRLYLRVFEQVPEKKIPLTKSYDIPVKFSDRSWYVNLPRTGMNYYISLCCKKGPTERILCTSNPVTSPKLALSSTESPDADEIFHGILAASGMQDIRDLGAKGGIPQRIISLLDTQYLHLKG